MTEHLPECWCSGRCPLYEGCSCPCRDCICSELRACEKRVLDAAQKAVAALPIAVYSYRPDESLRDVAIWKSDLLATIDALRGEE